MLAYTLPSHCQDSQEGYVQIPVSPLVGRSSLLVSKLRIPYLSAYLLFSLDVQKSHILGGLVVPW